MPIDIRPDHLKIVEEILEKYVPDREVWAFGSRATGKAKDTSDLDLAVIGETPLDFQTLAALRDAFSESNIPYRVDVVGWAAIGETFREIIRKDKVVIHKDITNGLGTEGFVRNYQELPFSHAVLVNPRTNLIRGKVYPFVDMATVSSDSHCVRTTEYRLFQGNGSKFAVGDTLMARITPCLENGKIARFCAEHGAVGHGSTEFIVIRGRKGFTENDYAYYLTKWDNVRNYAISQMTGTSGRQRVQTGAFDHLLVSIPSLPEQRAIAHILCTLDDKIELNRCMNETLEAMAQAIFKSWFVDLDPVRAKIEGRETGLPKEIEDLFPDSFEDSELGEIPRDWRSLPLGELLSEVNERVGDKDIPEYSSTNEGLQPRSERYKKKLSVSSADNKIIRRGYLVFGLSRRILNFGLMRDEIGSVSSAYKVFAINGSLIEPDLVERVMRLKTNYYYNAISGSSREGQSISGEGLKQLSFIVPNKAVQNIFYKITDPLQNRLLLLQRESDTLIQIRDNLLPKLLAGEIWVKDAEEFLG
ncbi:MAG: restriction endonuclease subunit S [Leptospirales bacterium]